MKNKLTKNSWHWALIVIALILFSVAKTTPLEAKTLTQKNEINKITNNIENQIKNGSLRKQTKHIEYLEPYEPTLKEIYYDKSNIARKLIIEAGSEDSAITENYYYNSEQKLIFVLIKGGSTNGAHMEHVIYFSTDGKRIQEKQKYSSGPKYTFPEVWPENQIIFNPWDEFNK